MTRDGIMRMLRRVKRDAAAQRKPSKNAWARKVNIEKEVGALDKTGKLIVGNRTYLAEPEEEEGDTA